MGRFIFRVRRAAMAVRAMTTPAFMSRVPGPEIFSGDRRQGIWARVPRGQTVSRWPRMRMDFLEERAGPKRSSRTSP